MSIFYPASSNFIKKHAKQLQGVFPALSLATCQTVTARALGFEDYHDATKRIGSKNINPSRFDEDIAYSDHLMRRYQQIRALVDYANIPSLSADHLVRLWNLTAKASSALSEFADEYDNAHKDILALESGELSKEDIEDVYDLYPPVRVADGVINAAYGYKYSYFHLSQKLLFNMPLYLRGEASVFLDFESGNNVKIAYPELFQRQEVTAALAYLMQHEPCLYEWHTGKTAPGYHGLTIGQILEAAKKTPSDWFALSIRQSNKSMGQEYAIPAIIGSDFVKFIEEKGSLRGLNLQWFAPKEQGVVMRLFGLWYHSDMSGTGSYNRLSLHEMIPTTPLYGSPFKSGPMSSMEYSELESGAMMLTDELEDDEGDGDVLAKNSPLELIK